MKRLTAIVVVLGAMTLFSLPVYANSTGNQGALFRIETFQDGRPGAVQQAG